MFAYYVLFIILAGTAVLPCCRAGGIWKFSSKNRKNIALRILQNAAADVIILSITIRR